MGFDSLLACVEGFWHLSILICLCIVFEPSLPKLVLHEARISAGNVQVVLFLVRLLAGLLASLLFVCYVHS